MGVVLDTTGAPNWVNALLEFLKGFPMLDVSVVGLEGEPRRRRPAWLLERLYRASKSRFDPFGDTPLPAGSSLAKSVEDLAAEQFGLLLWLADQRRSDVDIRGIAKHGVLTVRLGEQYSSIPFWDEVTAGDVTSSVRIFWHEHSFSEGRVVRTAETSTSHGLYFTESAQAPLVATVRLLGSLCLEAQNSGARFGQTVRGAPIQHMLGPVGNHHPSNTEAAQFAIRKVARSAYLRMTKGRKRARWFVAIRPNSGRSITNAEENLSGFKDVPLPSGVAVMADPFLHQGADRNHLFFEEVAAGRSRGRIGCVELLPDGTCSEMRIVLDRPYHLSYPCIVRSGNDVFLMPESAEAERVDLYRFTTFPEVELVSSLVERAALVDTTPFLLDGCWYFFTTTCDPFMETLLFTSSRLDGPWTPHPCNPVSTSVKHCRSAGQMFWDNGRLYRPTQDCSVRYGYAININEVTVLTPTAFEERRVSTVPPTWRPKLLGTHTWGQTSAWQAIDGIRWSS